MAFTPAIQQYVDIKKQHEDCILFFRMGDFYETFFEDAKICSKVLDLILTSKNKEAENPIPMAGIPHHSLDKYIPKLIYHGYKIALAEQTTEPVPGKIVEREVTQIITPGTYIQDKSKNYSYLMSVLFFPSSSGENYHIAWGDFTMGEYQTKSFSDPDKMQKFMLTIRPIEIIFDIDFPAKDNVSRVIEQSSKCLISVYDVPVDPEKFITNKCKIQTIASFGKALEDGRLSALGLLLNYINNTQKKALSNIVRISLHSNDQYVLFDDITVKNLEIFASSYEGSEKYSLAGIIDNTKTLGGSRLIRKVLANPTNNIEEINWRLDNIGHHYENIDHAKYIHGILNNVLDIPKIITNILYKKLLPSNFIKLRATIRIFLEKQEMLNELLKLGLTDETLTQVQHIFNYLDKLLKDDIEYSEDIDFIRDGYDNKLDELRKVAYHSDELLLNYQQELVQVSGISNVKLKFVMNQGYFIEITNKDVDQFEKTIKNFVAEINSDEGGKFDLIRRNTLKGAQRYVTPYLDQTQEQVLKAKDELVKIEFDLLTKTKENIGDITQYFSEFAEKISWLDLFVGYALLAKNKGYIKPEIGNNKVMEIVGGRHPVIEEFLPTDQQFIPNDLNMISDGNKEDDKGFLHIITGPNMGGKSTYLRQNALIVLMAHCGLRVSAESCKIGLVDGIFARIGSGDIITKNQSTFMTEMIEVANILNNASSKSFIIFDELGRGTSTYDGLALTKAILEYIATNTKAKTLIATHYHELINMENTLPGIKNYSVMVYETEKEVVFMKKIARGGANKSYGLDVAKIAGIRQSIIDKAKENLDKLEPNNIKSDVKLDDKKMIDTVVLSEYENQKLSIYEKLKSLVKSFDINNITPLQALQLLSKIKDELNN